MKLPLFIILLITSCATQDQIITDKELHNYNSSNLETQLAELINAYRISQGKNSLQIVNHISFKSSEHNFYMIENNVVNHNGFEARANNIMQVLGAVKVGENIGYNYSTPNAVLYAWLSSPEHKEKLDGDYTHFGISITSDNQGRKYYTNMFMK